MTTVTIGFVGLGNMGGPMAANLVKAGHRVAGYDTNHAAVKAFAAAGGHAAGSAADAARDAQVVITMLPAGEQVRSVWLQGGLLAAAKAARPLLIDCSTIDVATARQVAEAAREAGLAMLDAPVSGGVAGATGGTLTFMVGGTGEAFACGRPILQAMGKIIVHAGGPGAGQAAKICNNMMLAINMIGVSEAFLLAEKLGLDWNKLHQIAGASSGQSWALTAYCPAPGPVPGAPSNRDYAAGFAAALMLKDVTLSQDAAASLDVPTPLGAHAAALFRQAVEAGEGARDFSVVFRWLSGQSRKDLVS